jgi:hypothetical protein
MKKLIFGKGNAKLSSDIITFSLPAGWTCPGASLCQSFADRQTGKIKDGKKTEFRCFAASQEARPNVRAARWHNFDQLKKYKTAVHMAALILESLDETAKFVRIHVSGDYFSQAYADAWVSVAKFRPSTVFYSYTKSIHFFDVDNLPENFRLTASLGGKFDELIRNVKTARVILDAKEAEALSLEIDHDDMHAIEGTESFALLIHGTQPKGSDASKAIRKLKADGVKYSYNKKTRKP